MKPNDSKLEDRLRAEARAIFAGDQIESAAGRILAEHGRRARRRLLRRTAAGAVAAALTTILAIAAWQDTDGWRRHAATASTSFETSTPQAPPEPVVFNRLTEVALQDAGESAVAIPLLVTVGQWEGRPVVAPVVYVPPHARRVEHTSLTDAERSAVERLLKLTTNTRSKGIDVTL